MTWDIEYTDFFGAWWDELQEAEQESVAASVRLLEEYGAGLRHPHSSQVNGSRYGHMRELRIQHEGRPYRVLYAFDPNRAAILLLGGDKTGQNRWYEQNIPRADALYREHLAQLKQEEADNGQKVCGSTGEDVARSTGAVR
ncbi:MAG TPA: type II toxin-antitoxin system RelE/ParE family toxin [Paraburkholderia sp.]|jgi:hypothetical protein